MTLNPISHIETIYADVQSSGFHGLWYWISRMYYRNFVSVNGLCIFDVDWDVLIILDACRADLFEEVIPEYNFLTHDRTKRVSSVGSKTTAWMERTFTSKSSDAMANTIYVSASPYTDSCIDDSKFQYLDEVWKYQWDENMGTVLPRPVTDRAISHWRTASPDRLLIHYMQPHIPFIPANNKSDLSPENFGEDRFDDTWHRLQEGDVSRQEVWKQYRANLEYVLNDIELLLASIDADSVVITSDHGNAFGEFGIFGHYDTIPIPVLRTVPWSETTANRINKYEPSKYDTNTHHNDLSDQLRALGYKN
jgi:hypothetical protein